MAVASDSAPTLDPRGAPEGLANQDGPTVVIGAPPAATGTWTLRDCLSYGLGHHPALKQARGSVQSSKARIESTRSGLGTKVSAQAGWSRRRTEYSRSLAQSKIGGTSDPLVDSTSEGLTLRKTLTDFGRTATSLRSLRRGSNAAEASLAWQEIMVGAEIKTAFLRVQQAAAMVEVQREALTRDMENLRKVRGFVEVGNRPPYDITKAQATLANSQVALLRAENTWKNALAALANATGLDGPVAAIGTETVLLSEIATDVASLLAESLERPDLEAARHQTEAARLNEKEARMGKRPSLSGSADYSWGGSVTPLDRSYSLGLSLSAPILDGSLTKAQVKDARGQVMSAEGRLAEQMQNTRTQLETALNDVEETRQRIAATAVLLQVASETLTLADGRYEEGVGSALEVTDARAGYTNARGSHVSANFDHLIALTTLERILGRIPAEALTTPVQP